MKLSVCSSIDQGGGKRRGEGMADDSAVRRACAVVEDQHRGRDARGAQAAGVWRMNGAGPAVGCLNQALTNRLASYALALKVSGIRGAGREPGCTAAPRVAF